MGVLGFVFFALSLVFWSVDALYWTFWFLSILCFILSWND